MVDSNLLLISRDDIIRASEEIHGSKVFQLLASLTRLNFHLLATAPQPDRFVSAHGGPDDALLGPNSIRNRLSDAGGALDGVYYVPRSLLTQKRNREQALKDMLQRYSSKPANCYLFSSSKKFVDAAVGLGIRGIHLNKHNSLTTVLRALSKSIQQ